MIKKGTIFVVSFIVLYFVIQLGSGFLQTWLYTPDIDEIWKKSSTLPSTVTFGQSGISGSFPWITLLISLGLALFISIVRKRSKA